MATLIARVANTKAIPLAPGIAAVVLAPQRRRMDPFTMEKVHGDASVSLLRSWRNRWNDYVA